jgi:hypothetical protein
MMKSFLAPEHAVLCVLRGLSQRSPRLNKTPIPAKNA